MKCLLIGGAGFIGHNLAIGLIKEGHEVKIIDSFMVNNLTSVISNEDDLLYPEWSYHILKSRINSLKEYNIEIASTDARDYHLLSREVSDFKPDVIYHLAAVSHANRSNKTPHNTFDHSFRTLENALDVSKSLGCRFIYFSSSMIYGSFPGEEVTEESPLSPLGIYGTLKWCGEKLVHAYNKVFGLEYVIVRPSALYGERCISRRVGQVFIESALFGEEITIE